MNRHFLGDLPRITAPFALAALLFSACGDDDAPTPGVTGQTGSPVQPAGPDAGPSAAPTTPATGGQPAAKPLYAVRSQVNNPDGVITYVSIVDNLDSPDLNLDNALEFPGYVTIDTRDGDLYVSDGTQAKLTRYAIDLTGSKPTVREVGVVGLSGYAFAPDALTPTADPSKVYLTNDGNPTLLGLDPTRMALTGDFTLPNLKRDGFRPRSSPTLTNAQGVLRSFFFQHNDDPRVSEDTQIIFIDPATDAVKSVTTETRCPVMNRLTQDEQGTIYFSTWFYSAGMHQRGNGAATCGLRMKAGQTTMDPDWKLDYAAITGGRDAGELAYVRNGKAILSVFHHERVTPADVEKNAWEVSGTNNWRIWSVDLATQKGTPLEDIPWSAGDHRYFSADGRLFIFIPADEWTDTTIYEILGDATQAVPVATGRGWINKIVKLR